MVKKRQRHSAAYEFRVALEGSKKISQLSSEYREKRQPDTGLETAPTGRRA